jgi:hypothetical protein
MKCIKCNTDNTYKDRTKNTRRCKNCGHEFVFEPYRLMERKFTDAFFANLITDVSANNTLFFTPSQLYYLLNKRLRSRDRSSNNVIGFIGVPLIFIVLIASISEKNILGITISTVLTIGSIFIYVDRQRNRSKVVDKLLIDRTKFDDWLYRWNCINNPSEKILAPPQISSLSAVPNPEVTAYSFDRVVICDTPAIAQLLISNNFHFENNCAILTIDGYPQSIFDTTMEMLRRNPDLKVYALHNCSPSGIQLIHRLRADDTWFPDLATPIINVGILPRQIIDNLDLLMLQSPKSAKAAQQIDPAVRNTLNPLELAWLDAGCYLELESFSPRKLIQILQRAISESRELAVIEDDEMGSAKNPGSYAVESFG